MALIALFLLLCAASLSPAPLRAQPCPHSQDAAPLIAFKKAIFSDPLRLLSSWNLPYANCTSSTSSLASPCGWTGVVCESLRVVALQLNNSQLRGTVSPSLAQLSFLRSLDLSSNNFSGGIPVELRKCLSLTLLDLSGNQLRGIIPADLGTLEKLKTLYLYGNVLTGGVTKALANCTNLRELSLSGNQLSGNIPTELGLLNKLKYLDISENMLSGGVPAALGNCTNLRVLSVAKNPLSGNIPADLGRLSNLKILYLWGNKLMGEVPAALANCTALTDFQLSSNELSGSIPTELGRLSKLKILYLWGNKLTGEVPAALANCTALTQIELNSNELLGNIPAELGRLSKLEILFLRVNKLTGEVPAALANCTALTDLELSSNELSGSIPTELGGLSKLELLLLWGNNLTGEVPGALANCTALTIFSISLNDISGSIPAELGMLSRLEFLGLYGNQLKGEVPKALANCTAVTFFLLNENLLFGSIPAELGRLNNLKRLDLRYNRFTGGVPATLANCTNLTSLFLSFNQLSGHITDVFCSWSSLDALYLNDNLLGGRLPPCLSGLEQLTEIYLQRNAFVGTIPEFSSLALNYLDASTNNLSGSIPESYGELQGLVSVDLSHNFFSGTVPDTLGSLQSLTDLNLSNNALSGSIPSALGSCSEMRTLTLSHNRITGTLPSTFVNLRSLTKLDLSYNQLAGHVPNIRPYNDTSVVDLSGNPMLCGTIVKRTCVIERASSSVRRTVALIVAVLAGVLLILLGLVSWRCHSRVGRFTKIDSDRRLSHPLERKQLKVSANQLREATDGFSDDNILGVGGVSIVYKGVLADGSGRQTTVAVKVLKAEVVTGAITKAEVFRLKREVKLLAMVRHRNVVRVLGCCFNLEMQAIVLELVPNGNLDHYLHGMQRRDALTEKEKLHILRAIAHGLEYLHHWHNPRESIVHCDLKPANILLDEEWEPLIADFGIAKLLQHGKDVNEKSASLSVFLRGSVGYIPPEYAFGAQVSSAGDVYSFGVVMLEILAGQRPTEVANGWEGEQRTLMSLVQAAYPDQLLGLFQTPDMTADEAVVLAELGLLCTSSAPQKRPTMLQVGRALNTITELSLQTRPYPTLLELLDG